MNREHTHFFLIVMGLGLVLTGGVYATGAIPGPWSSSVTTRRWDQAEVHGVYVPEYLEPGKELVTVVFTAYNGHDSDGSLLFDMLVSGHASGGTSGLQFTPSVSAMSARNITVTLYRVPIVMGDRPITVTVRDGMTGLSQVTATIQPGTAPTPEPDPEPDPGPDPVDTNPGTAPDTEPEPFFLVKIREYAPAATIQSLVLGAFMALGGTGVMIYGASSRWNE